MQYFGRFNPYSGEPLTRADNIAIFGQRLVVFIGAELLIVYNNYLAQRDLITQVIKTHMTRQQQTMLRSFFKHSNDPILVVLNSKVLYANEAAKALQDVSES